MTGKKLNARILFILFIISAGILMPEGIALAQTAPQYLLDIDSLNMQKGVSSNLVLSIINAQGAELTGISGLENFDVVSTGNSTSTQIINGASSYEEDVNYIIMPKNVGKFTLQGSVKYNGRIYQTNQLQINVSEADRTKNGEKADYFIKTILSTGEAYIGQKVVLAYELYSRYNIENFGFSGDTSIKDFISKDVPQDKLQAEIVTVDGNKYAKYEARQSFISPIKTGTFTIPAYNFQANVSTGDFFNSSTPVYLQTESKKITVKPLPLNNQPADFSGIVGKLNLDAKYSKNEVNYGDSLTLDITASGDCNLDNLKEIVKDDLSGFSVYQTEKSSEEGIKNNLYHAKKQFEVILVPKTNGELKIDSKSISYFNPASGNYEKVEIPGTTINVKGETPQGQTGVQNQDASTPIETVKIDQVSYTPQNDGYFTIQLKKGYLMSGLIIMAILLVLAVAVYLVFLTRRKYDKKLQSIYRQLKKEEDQNEIYNLFNSLIKHSFNLSLKANTRNMIVNRLAEYGLANPVLEIMDYMENGKYRTEKEDMNLKEKIRDIYKRICKLKNQTESVAKRTLKV
jgi:hypothetical protein